MNARDYEQLVQRLGNPRVLVVGDLILDRYVWGTVSRISPEAPIPILTATRSEDRLGGALNVVANLVAMEAQVDVVGIVGNDAAADALRGLLNELGVDSEGCIADPARPTIQKTRMMSASQQMLRVDNEDSRPVSEETIQKLLAALPERVKRSQAVVLSDYGKGVLSPAVIELAISTARKAGIPVLVDPKGEDYTRYRGATLVTPNKKEAEQAIGRKLPTLADLPAAADELMRVSKLDAAVITLGPDGIYFKTKLGHKGHVPALARAVYDVTGAGDTVVAQLGFCLADGLSLDQAVGLANQAAAIVVGRIGTHAVTRSELHALFRDQPPEEGKIVEGDRIDQLLATWRKEGKRIVFTNGCFDVLHAGHVQYLRFARAKGDVLFVGINDDESVRRLKGSSRPINALADRMNVLAALEMVDAVASFADDTPAKIIQRVTPNVLVKGEDWAGKGVVGKEWVEAHGGQVVLAPLLPNKSTTGILAKARATSDN